MGSVADLAQQRLGMSPRRRRAGVHLRRDQLAGSLLRLSHARPTWPRSTRQIEGNFVGLGVELKADDGRLAIVRVITGSPAEQAGIRAGDRILPIDGQLASSMSTDQAANLLQGKEGTVVQLSLAAAGDAARQSSVRRRRVDVPSVDNVHILDAAQGIGYLKLTCFQKTTCRDLDDALWKLHRGGMQGGLIIDLRGNPGGLLVPPVEVVDKFVEHGMIVSTRGRNVPRKDFTYSAHEAGTWRRAAGGADRPGQRQRGGDLRRGDPRPPPRHDRRLAELRQGLGPRDLPLARRAAPECG